MATGWIVGVVTDAASNKPVANVQVTASIKGTGAAASGPKPQTVTAANGGYSLELESMSGGYGWIYLITFTKAAYHAATGEVSPLGPASIKTLNVQLSPTSAPPVTPPTVPPVTVATKIYGYRVEFIRYSWATEARLRSLTPTLANEAYRIANDNFRNGVKYQQVSAKLNWAENNWEFRFQKVGSPVLPPLVIGAIILAGIIVAGICIWRITEFIEELGRQDIQTQTEADVNAFQKQVLDAVNKKQITPEQGNEMLATGTKALTTAATATPATSSAWPTVEQLTPIIIVIAIIGVFAVAYGFLSKR